MNVKDFTQYVTESYGGGDKYFYHGTPHVFNRFDMSKVGTGDGLSKYGHGLYFADTIEAAQYYAKDLTVGKLRDNGYNLYTVRLLRLADYVEWERGLDEDRIHEVCRSLERAGHEDTADEVLDEYRSYGDYTMESLYSMVSSTLGGDREATELMYDAGIAGVIVEHVFLDCKVYVAFSDENVKIIDSEQLDFGK